MKACKNKRKLNRLLAFVLSMITLVVMMSSTVLAANVVTSYEPPKTAEISLNKTSKLPDYTNGNENYTLKGAEYTVYSNSACTSMVGKITTDENGKGKITGLPLGEYWVKETKASTGYSKDTEVYHCDLRSGSEAVIKGTVNSNETPMMDPVAVLVQKTGSIKPDADKGQTLADAQFEFKFYDNKPTTVDPATQGEKPKWTWVFKTLDNGMCQFSNICKVSGPEIPKNTSGNNSLPYGTITIKEIKAPNGFSIDPTVFVVPIDNKGGSTVGPVYQEPTIKDKSIDFMLKKVHIGEDGKTYPIANAKFKHTLPNGTTETVTTNEYGNFNFKGLTVGKHVIEEIEVPGGFALNTNKITFEIDEDLNITNTSNPIETDTNGTFTIAISPGKGLDGIYENKLAPFKLHIHKINDKDFSLEGAEFTVYNDSKCTDVFAKGISNANGNIEFENLIPGREYWVKETKAPQGYRIPVNDDGSDIIWKIKVSSYPTEGRFTFYVNDKAYEGEDGQFHISGSPENRVVNMEIINPIGAKLPNTGSSAMLIMVILGVVLAGGTIVYTKIKKK